MSRYVCEEGTLPSPVLTIPGEIPATRPIRSTFVAGGRIATITRGASARPAATDVVPETACACAAAGIKASDARMSGMDRTFAKFTFFKLDPAWQRWQAAERAEDKREFLAACEDFAQDRSLRAYSTVGMRGDTDLLLLSQSPHLDDIHTFHVVLAQSGLAKWATVPHSYLAMTKPSPYSDSQTRTEICTSERKYCIVYPLDKKREWYRLPLEERRRVMAEHIEIGRRYPEITINTTYSFGLDDQEFVVSFECDDPGEFLDLVQELRTSESSAFTLRDIPIFTCVAMSTARALDALDGTAAGATLRAV
jgi:chlorite dismutase